MPRELISVLMPVYKASEKYLSEAITSILGQDYYDFELIIVEDPSDFTAESVIKKINDARIIYTLNPVRTGFVAQLNAGIKQSQGAYIARMDADDIAERSRLSQQVELLNAHPEISVVGSNLTIIDENDRVIGKRIYPQNHDLIVKKMRLINAMAHPAVMVKKEALLKIGGYGREFDTLADYDLWARLVLAGYKFYNLQMPLLRYRLHLGATKSLLLKRQLGDTINIKNKYFRFKSGWNLKCELRYWAEKIMTLLPNYLIYRLYILINVKKGSSR